MIEQKTRKGSSSIYSVCNIMSWNTLYRLYEEKYNPSSNILKRYPNEKDRLDEIVDIIQVYADRHTVICLQEVSLQLLSLLRERAGTNLIFEQKIREEEYLVTITPAAGFVKETWEQHPSGNGYLVVSNHKYRVVNCHLVPQKYTKVKVLEYIKNLPRDKIMIIAGDFNAKYKHVVDALESRYIIPRYGKTYKNKTIDHIIVDKSINIVNYVSKVIETDSVSDHKAIVLEIGLS